MKKSLIIKLALMACVVTTEFSTFAHATGDGKGTPVSDGPTGSSLTGGTGASSHVAPIAPLGTPAATVAQPLPTAPAAAPLGTPAATVAQPLPSAASASGSSERSPSTPAPASHTSSRTPILSQPHSHASGGLESQHELSPPPSTPFPSSEGTFNDNTSPTHLQRAGATANKEDLAEEEFSPTPAQRARQAASDRLVCEAKDRKFEAKAAKGIFVTKNTQFGSTQGDYLTQMTASTVQAIQDLIANPSNLELLNQLFDNQIFHAGNILQVFAALGLAVDKETEAAINKKHHGDAVGAQITIDAYRYDLLRAFINSTRTNREKFIKLLQFILAQREQAMGPKEPQTPTARASALPRTPGSLLRAPFSAAARFASGLTFGSAPGTPVLLPGTPSHAHTPGFMSRLFTSARNMLFSPQHEDPSGDASEGPDTASASGASKGAGASGASAGAGASGAPAGPSASGAPAGSSASVASAGTSATPAKRGRGNDDENESEGHEDKRSKGAGGPSGGSSAQ